MKTPIHLDEIRSRLKASHGREYWRSLEEFADTPENRDWLEKEFAAGEDEGNSPLSRRSFLTLMAASLAMAGSGCTKMPVTEIVPYVQQPEEIVLGEPMHYATAMALGGYGIGLLMKSREGRPIKADGNQDHPASLGGSDVWIQACLLDLYNPDRAQAISHYGEATSWNFFLDGLDNAMEEQRQSHGDGLRILTGTVTSPTLGAQLEELLKTFPKAKWHQYEPVNRDNAQTGAQQAFGKDAAAHCRFDRASVVLGVDADVLQFHPEHLRYSRHFIDQRRVVERGPKMSRCYAIESTPTLFGSMADHRLPLSSAQLETAMVWLADYLGVNTGRKASEPAGDVKQWLTEVAKDLQGNRGASLVTVGHFQPPFMHEAAHRINHALGNNGKTVYYTDPAEVKPVLQVDSLRDLAEDLNGGKVGLLIVLGGNPAYDAPADLEFASVLRRAKHSVHLSLDYSETSAVCEWLVPRTHFLEAWGDVRAYDGTITIQQPLIAPLFGGTSDYELLQIVARTEPRAGYDIVRDYWRKQNRWQDFEQGWSKAVQDGVVENTAMREISVDLREPSAAAPMSANENAGELEVLFRPDSSVWDGRFADNPWLQEIPRPFTSLTWDNAVLISPKLAERGKYSNGDVVELRLKKRYLQAAIWILPGQAENTVTLNLGYGRRRGGASAIDVGFNAYSLRTSDALWQGGGLEMTGIGQRYAFAAMQVQHRLHSQERQVYREGTLEEFQKNPSFLKKSVDSPSAQDTLYNPDQYAAPLKWGMSIDLTACIGCNACSMACNIENNIPVVGPSEVARGREMLWIRIDNYFRGTLDNPEFDYQPVPCMHCENAPCEYVCPVAATLHSDEGLNLQIYNRCIGTRYCSNNCPYKVRRFNFLGYATQTPPLLALRNNPEVSVRARGVMEKCTYCVQRIARVRIKAEEAKRPIAIGEVHTACEEACPTRAIVFGIMTNRDDPVTKAKAHPLDYPMLGEINTRPRTTYIAKIRNPNPAIASQTDADTPEADTSDKS